MIFQQNKKIDIQRNSQMQVCLNLSIPLDINLFILLGLAKSHWSLWYQVLILEEKSDVNILLILIINIMDALANYGNACLDEMDINPFQVCHVSYKFFSLY